VSHTVIWSVKKRDSDSSRLWTQSWQ